MLNCFPFIIIFRAVVVVVVGLTSARPGTGWNRRPATQLTGTNQGEKLRLFISISMNTRAFN